MTSQWWPSLLTNKCVTWLQWVNTLNAGNAWQSHDHLIFIMEIPMYLERPSLYSKGPWFHQQHGYLSSSTHLTLCWTILLFYYTSICMFFSLSLRSYKTIETITNALLCLLIFRNPIQVIKHKITNPYPKLTPNSNKVITAKFCTWHNSCAVVSCAKFCSDLMANNRIIIQIFYGRIA